MTCDAATAKREEEEKWNDGVRQQPENSHISNEGRKKKDKEKSTDDKTVSIIL